MGCGSSNSVAATKSEQYERLKILGKGASCHVVSVRDKQGNKHALKVLQKKDGKGKPIAENKGMYANEVAVLASLSHDNILKLVDSWEDNEAFNILTTFCGGGELFDRVKDTFMEKGRFTEGDAVALITQSLESIAYCHDKQVVHRDIKPENFVFETKSKDSPMLLIDFGCARIVQPEAVVPDVAGSPYYVAPEVLSDRMPRTGSIWKASDMWSIGVILYLFVCGQPPFDGQSHDVIFRSIKRGSFHYPSDATISDQVKDLINKLLVPDPTKRLSARQALAHPWITANLQKDAVLDKRVVDGLTNFQAQCRLKKAVGRVLANRLTENDKESLRSAFKEFDENGDGVLGPDEIARMIKKIGRSNIDSKELLKMMDEDGDGEINEIEFQAAHAAAQVKSEEDIKKTFDMFDADGDGFVTNKEIEKVCDFLTPEAVTQLIQDVDSNKDGKVNFEEWLVAMSSAKSAAAEAMNSSETAAAAAPPVA